MTQWRLKMLSLFALAAVCAGGAFSAECSELRAGAAKVSISPSADEFPYSTPREKDFVGVHDDLYARALVLDDGATKVALVSVEVVEIPDPERVVSEVAQAIGVPVSHVMVTATHSHSTLLVFFHGGIPSPIQAKEIEHIRQGAVAAARKAASDLQPARIAFSRGEAWVNINNGEVNGLKTRYDANGPSDKTLDVMRVDSSSGQSLALIVDYPNHAEVMFRSVTKDGGYEVTGDLPGAVSQILESNPAGAPVTLFLAGDEGDQKNLFQAVQPAFGKLPATDEGAASWGVLDIQAKRLATAVFESIGKMQTGASTVTLQVGVNSATCPGQRTHLDSKTGQTTTEDTPPVIIPLSTIQINDIAFAAIGGDVGSEIGKKIREASPVPHTIVVTMLAGTVGYILSDASYAHPGHVRESPLKPGCAEKALPEGISHLLSANSK
jgi:hypothetical protein